MRYAGWNLEKTLLVNEPANIDRPRELVNVRVAVEGERAANVPADVRVILKRDWNVLDREIPCQVHQVARHGGTTTFRVAFNLDIPPGGGQRVGVYYDNPAAAPPVYQTDLDVRGDGLGYRVDTPFYTVETDPASGQIAAITGKIDDQGGTLPRRLALPGLPQEGNVVLFAVADGSGSRAVPVSTADWCQPEIVEESRGPIFFKQTRRGRLVPPNGEGVSGTGILPVNHGQDAHATMGDWPELEVTYKFFAEQPYFLIHSKLTFPADTGVFGVYNDVLTLARDQFSHYTFRPVSPALPETDVEEMGHVLVDPAWTADLPDGLAFSGFLPHNLAWHSFINMHLHKQHAISGIQLLSTTDSPAGPAVAYRPGTYLFRDQKAVQWFRAPIYVHTLGRAENVITVPAGTVFEELNAVLFSGWDEHWGQRVDGLGKRLNTPLRVTSHPVYVGEPLPPEPFEALPAGTRADAYRRAGVR